MNRRLEIARELAEKAFANPKGSAVITDSNEMLVSGKLPFTIEQLDIDKKVQTDSVTTF